MFKRLFCWAYFRGSLFLEGFIFGGNFAFQNGLDLTMKTASTNSPWAYIREGLLSEGYFASEIWGAYFWEGLFWGAYYRNFTVCKQHNKINLQNKPSKFNIEASVRFKRKAVLEHGNSQQHKSAVEAELIRRVSAFHKEIERRDQSRDDAILSAFLSLYWLVKEEVVHKKFAALLEMTELLGLSDMKFFNHRSAGATCEMLLILGQVIKKVTLEKVKRVSCFTLLCHEVCNNANNEQLVR